MARRDTLNDSDREEWISNQEDLSAWQQSSGQSMRAFVRANRAELDRIIRERRDAPPPGRTWRDFV